MPFTKNRYSRIDQVPPSCRESTALFPMFPGSELLDEALTMYYLQNLPECRINVAKGLALLYELEESEEQIYQAVTLRSRNILCINGTTSNYSDQGIFRLQEECDNEKRVIQNERTLLQNHIKNENHKIVILEGCIFSLPEPHRSVIISRYLERMPWPLIQQKLKRSASRIFSLHKEGIIAIHEAIRVINEARELSISQTSCTVSNPEKP